MYISRFIKSNSYTKLIKKLSDLFKDIKLHNIDMSNLPNSVGRIS